MGLPRAPFSPPATPPRQNVRAVLDDIARSLEGKLDHHTEPVFPSILLAAPNGSHYRLTVDNAGTLTATLVART